MMEVDAKGSATLKTAIQSASTTQDRAQSRDARERDPKVIQFRLVAGPVPSIDVVCHFLELTKRQVAAAVNRFLDTGCPVTLAAVPGARQPAIIAPTPASASVPIDLSADDSRDNVFPANVAKTTADMDSKAPAFNGMMKRKADAVASSHDGADAKPASEDDGASSDEENAVSGGQNGSSDPPPPWSRKLLCNFAVMGLATTKGMNLVKVHIASRVQWLRSTVTHDHLIAYAVLRSSLEIPLFSVKNPCPKVCTSCITAQALLC